MHRYHDKIKALIVVQWKSDILKNYENKKYIKL